MSKKDVFELNLYDTKVQKKCEIGEICFFD